MKRNLQIDLTENNEDDLFEIDLLKTPTKIECGTTPFPVKKVKKEDRNIIDLDEEVEIIEVKSKTLPVKKEIKPKVEDLIKQIPKSETQTPTRVNLSQKIEPIIVEKEGSPSTLQNSKIEKGKIETPIKKDSKQEEVEIIDLEGSEHILKLTEQQSQKLVVDYDSIPEKEPPKTIITKLKPYQKQALHWMTEQEKKSKGGILADEMGLGKSLEMLSTVMCDNKLKNLIVLPKALLSNWEDEIEKHISESLTTRYYGRNKEDYQSLLIYDFVLTTYTTLLNEYKQHLKGVQSPLFKMHWHRVILDEAHLIKNQRAISAQAACALKANIKWALTGTPIHNELGDLYSLFKFVKFSPYDDQFVFKRNIFEAIEKDPKSGFDNLVAICSKILLRRTKDMKIKGQNIVDIPEKTAQDVECTFSNEERDLYDKIFKKAQIDFNMLLLQGESVVLKNYMEILANLLRLRQLCDHSVLITTKRDTHMHIETCLTCSDRIEEGVLTPCGHYFCDKCIGVFLSIKPQCPQCKKDLKEDDLKEYSTKPQFLQNFMHSAKTKKCMDELKLVIEKKEKVLIFSQWTSFLDLLEIPIKREKYEYIKVDGRTDQKDRDFLFDKFRKRDETNIALLSLRSCGLGLNLVEACHVFFMDLWWNPQVEAQALDRTHRIGQKKNVQVKRFIVKQTIEEKIIKLQEHKKVIADGALGVDVTQNLSKLSVENLKFLFTEESDHFTPAVRDAFELFSGNY